MNSDLFDLSYSTQGLSYYRCTNAGGGYVKVGNLVIINIRLVVTTAAAVVSGLPKPFTNSTYNSVGGASYDTANESVGTFYVDNNGDLRTTYISGTGTFMISVVYISH